MLKSIKSLKDIVSHSKKLTLENSLLRLLFLKCSAVVILALGFGIAYLSNVLPSSTYADTLKVTICHIPQGNPENVQTITISENAVDVHLSHGDRLGDCSILPVCGNWIIEGDEECDAGNLNGTTQSTCSTSCIDAG